MEIEIWSDIVCPFCYIGKRRFEEALAQFTSNENIKVTWKSYLLNPDQKTDPSLKLDQYLANVKGWQLDYAQQLNRQVTEMAESVGLAYNLDNAVIANSFKAHRLIHLAATTGLADAAEEALFKAYFTQGRNIDDNATLFQLGESIGLDPVSVNRVLQSDDFGDEVKRDILEARQLGVRGVPFFLVNGKYAVSGAQPTEVFLQTLEKAARE
jgi:predicted DsbA family dithiol-disulfide isomerase